MLSDIGVGQDLSHVAGHQAQKLVLGRGQGQQAPRLAGASGRKINLQRAVDKHGILGGHGFLHEA